MRFAVVCADFGREIAADWIENRAVLHRIWDRLRDSVYPRGPWREGLGSLNFVHFQGPEHVEKSIEHSTKNTIKHIVFV